MRLRLLALSLLLGCSGGDLTLPSSGRPVILRPVAGDDQRAEAGETLDQPIVVEVLDEADRPVSGSTVEFGFLAGAPGAVLHPAVARTDESGRAAAVVRLGVVAGEQTIVARVAGTASPDLTARFTAFAYDDEGRGRDRGRGPRCDDEDDDDRGGACVSGIL